ncbi:hypothetical protein GO491_05670 [Flavobacteriaceae bacterium Ap0902]|nr:hypothetical protein [Flavobacteriaceae bacterium Ap0902]
MMREICLSIFCSMILFACESKDDTWVAKYGNHVLTKTEVRKMTPNTLSPEDSIAFVKQLIDKWAKDKVLLNNSQEILSEEEIAQIDLKVARYRENITTSFVEEKLTNNLNDSISDSDIESYYHDYIDSFDLKEDYLSYRYMMIPMDSVSSYKALLRENQLAALESNLKNYGYAYDFGIDNWISKSKFDESDFFPEKLKKYNLKTKNQIFTVDQNNNAYIFELIEYKKAGEHAPLPIVKDMIKSVLINKRKLNLLTKKKKELYKKALQNDEIKRK